MLNLKKKISIIIFGILTFISIMIVDILTFIIQCNILDFEFKKSFYFQYFSFYEQLKLLSPKSFTSVPR